MDMPQLLILITSQERRELGVGNKGKLLLLFYSITLSELYAVSLFW